MYKSHQYHGKPDLSDGVYYKMLRGTNGLVTIACMQWFDETGYDQDRFITNSKDEIHVFETEDMARTKLNQWYKPKHIDPAYRNDPKQPTPYINNNVRDDE